MEANIGFEIKLPSVTWSPPTLSMSSELRVALPSLLLNTILFQILDFVQ